MNSHLPAARYDEKTAWGRGGSLFYGGWRFAEISLEDDSVMWFSDRKGHSEMRAPPWFSLPPRSHYLPLSISRCLLFTPGSHLLRVDHPTNS
jgi:hypothetical protein